MTRACVSGCLRKVLLKHNLRGGLRLLTTRELEGLWKTLCSGQAKLKLKLRTELFRNLVTALSRSFRECLRRSLGYFFFFPTTAPFFSTSLFRLFQFRELAGRSGSASEAPPLNPPRRSKR